MDIKVDSKDFAELINKLDKYETFIKNLKRDLTRYNNDDELFESLPIEIKDFIEIVLTSIRDNTFDINYTIVRVEKESDNEEIINNGY